MFDFQLPPKDYSQTSEQNYRVAYLVPTDDNGRSSLFEGYEAVSIKEEDYANSKDYHKALDEARSVSWSPRFERGGVVYSSRALVKVRFDMVAPGATLTIHAVACIAHRLGEEKNFFLLAVDVSNLNYALQQPSRNALIAAAQKAKSMSGEPFTQEDRMRAYYKQPVPATPKQKQMIVIEQRQLEDLEEAGTVTQDITKTLTGYVDAFFEKIFEHYAISDKYLEIK